MAAATVVATRTPEGNMTTPLSDCRLFRWSLSISNTDTHDTGFGTKVGIVDWALKPDLSTGDTTAVSDITNGVFTFATGGESVCDLLVWAKG